MNLYTKISFTSIDMRKTPSKLKKISSRNSSPWDVINKRYYESRHSEGKVPNALGAFKPYINLFEKMLEGQSYKASKKQTSEAWKILL